MNQMRMVVGIAMALALAVAAYAQQGMAYAQGGVAYAQGGVAYAQGGVAYAQGGLTGQWQGHTPAGTPVMLDLKATKTELTGTLTRAGEPTKIIDGKVEKAKFTFKATLEGQLESFTGEQQRDEIRVWIDRQGPEKAAVLKRVPKEAPGK